MLCSLFIHTPGSDAENKLRSYISAVYTLIKQPGQESPIKLSRRICANRRLGLACPGRGVRTPRKPWPTPPQHEWKRHWKANIERHSMERWAQKVFFNSIATLIWRALTCRLLYNDRQRNAVIRKWWPTAIICCGLTINDYTRQVYAEIKRLHGTDVISA